MSAENVYRFSDSLEKVSIYFEEVKLQIATEVMPAINALITDMSSEDSVVEGVIVGTILGGGLGLFLRLNIGDRELKPRKWEDVGSISVLAVVGGLIGGCVDYASKGF